MEDVRQQAEAYLSSHSKAVLATVNEDGTPMAHTIEYVSDGANIFFATMKGARKVANIAKNPTVALTVDEDYSDWLAIQGVQACGKAEVVVDESELSSIFHQYVSKFPFVADFPPNPDMVFVRVNLTDGFFLDYAHGFGHKAPFLN